MKEVTEKAADDMSKTQKKLLTNQESLAERQSMIGGLLQNNMEDILKEKKLIAAKHIQVEEYTKMINDQLGESLFKIVITFFVVKLLFLTPLSLVSYDRSVYVVYQFFHTCMWLLL